MLTALGFCAAVILSGCRDSSSSGAPQVQQRGPGEGLTALRSLARSSPSTIPAGLDVSGGHGDHASHGAESPAGAGQEHQASELLTSQLDAATAAIRRYPTAADAIDAGYQLGSPFAPGVGSHYVNWAMVDRPFDPAAPSMLLFDGDSPAAKIVGLSYWVRSASEPDGFDGAADHWHRHFGLCLVEGKVAGEGVPAADACEGEYLAGLDLWMLHVWLSPGLVNPAGVFAAENDLLTRPS